MQITITRELGRDAMVVWIALDGNAKDTCKKIIKRFF